MSDADLLDPLEDPDDTEDADGAEADAEVDDDFLPPRRKRFGRLTALLAALVLLGGGFLIGAEVQRGRGDQSSGRGGFPAAGGAFTGGTRARGAEAGGFPGGTNGIGGGAAGVGDTTGGTTGGSVGGGTGSDAASATPAVIGTVEKVDGNTIVVKNFGGKSITVTLTDSTAVTKRIATSALTKGDTVTVIGTTGSDGKVAATAVNAK